MLLPFNFGKCQAQDNLCYLEYVNQLPTVPISTTVVDKYHKGPFTRAIIYRDFYRSDFFRRFRWRENVARVNNRRFYCDFPNSRYRDIADVLNMFKFHCDISAIFFAEKLASKIVANISCVTVTGLNVYNFRMVNALMEQTRDIVIDHNHRNQYIVFPLVETSTQSLSQYSHTQNFE